MLLCVGNVGRDLEGELFRGEKEEGGEDQLERRVEDDTKDRRGENDSLFPRPVPFP